MPGFYVATKEAPRLTKDQIGVGHFKEKDRNNLLYWLASRRDILNIVDIAEQLKPTDKEQPDILEIGASTLFLSFLMAETNRAKVMAVEPVAEALEITPYEHPLLKPVHADADWVVKNFSGQPVDELDLVVWSWPTPNAKPLDILNKLGAKAVLLIMDLENEGYRFALRGASYARYIYAVNFDQFPGYRKKAMWKGFSWANLRSVSSTIPQHLKPSNLFVLYLREGFDLDLVPPRLGEIEEYPWIQEFEGMNAHGNPYLTTAGEVKLIPPRYELCPKYADD